MRMSLNSKRPILASRLIVCVTIAGFLAVCVLLYACGRAPRDRLRGGFLLCENKEDLLYMLDVFMLEDAKGFARGTCLPFSDRGNFGFSVLENDGDFVRIQILETPVIARTNNVFWTFRPAVYDESPERFMSLIRSSVNKGEVRSLALINPQTGQFGFCDEASRTAAGTSVRDPACEREFRGKGYIAVSEFQRARKQ